MHSHDRTFLASLGFADPDKKDSRHDLASQYLSVPEVKARLIQAAVPSGRRDQAWQFNADLVAVSRTRCHPIDRHQIEVHLVKGSGQYATTIGFLDMVVPVLVHREIVGERLIDSHWTVIQEDHNQMIRDIIIEIKINPIPIGDIVRQINFYRQYVKVYPSDMWDNVSRHGKIPNRFYVNPVWVLVCAFPLSEVEVESLNSESIKPVLLGAGFERWCVEQETKNRYAAPDPRCVEL